MQLEVVKNLCNDILDRKPVLIAGFVRLIFHDCVGGCDGCVDLNLENWNGDRPNAGRFMLQDYTDCILSLHL